MQNAAMEKPLPRNIEDIPDKIRQDLELILKEHNVPKPAEIPPEKREAYERLCRTLYHDAEDLLWCVCFSVFFGYDEWWSGLIHGDECLPHHYERYLKSPLWKSIRNRVLAASVVDGEPRCYCCGRRANQVHHRTYVLDVMAGLNDHGLVAICRDCHRFVEDMEDGGKAKRKRHRNHEDKELQLYHLCAHYGRPPPIHLQRRGWWG